MLELFLLYYVALLFNIGSYANMFTTFFIYQSLETCSNMNGVGYCLLFMAYTTVLVLVIVEGHMMTYKRLHSHHLVSCYFYKHATYFTFYIICLQLNDRKYKMIEL